LRLALAEQYFSESAMSESASIRQTIICRSSGRSEQIQQLGPYKIEPLIEREEENSGTAYRVHLGPNQRSSTSYHRVAEEYYYVLAGTGRAVLDGREHQVSAGDFLRLPSGTRHAFIAGEKGLELLDIHTPGCWPDRDTFFEDGIPQES
jgi:quercetin dioxygenase-like cupin family protein